MRLTKVIDHRDANGKEKVMAVQSRTEQEFARIAADPRSGASLVPMLIAGLVLIVVGMVAAFAFS